MVLVKGGNNIYGGGMREWYEGSPDEKCLKINYPSYTIITNDIKLKQIVQCDALQLVSGLILINMPPCTRRRPKWTEA